MKCCNNETNENHLLKQLKRHEGFRAHVYQCPAGKNTIGYGHNIDADPNMTPGEFGGGITESEAEAWLKKDIQQARDELFTRLPEMWDLKPARRDALINLVFNMGINTFAGSKHKRGFKNTIRAIRHGDFEEARQELFDSKWRRNDVGVSRSDEVGEQLRTGVYA